MSESRPDTWTDYGNDELGKLMDKVASRFSEVRFRGALEQSVEL